MPCVHKFRASSRPDYELCDLCGSWHSTAAIDPAKLYDSTYWTHERGHSTLAEQVHNVAVHEEDGYTKNEFVIKKLCWRPSFDESRALEIGCAPGVLLVRLGQLGFTEVVGIEADRSMLEEIAKTTGQSLPSRLVEGLFPYCTGDWKAGGFDLIVALDLFEHIPEPDAFLQECCRLLKPGGKLLLMATLADPLLPDRFYNPSEHVWLHSRPHIHMLMKDTGFQPPYFDRWTIGHETIDTRKICH